MSNFINETNRFNFDIAYMVYSTVYDNWNKLSDKEQKKARRQVESTVRETGFNGNSTGLISEAALQTVINQMKGIKATKDNRTALEHPVTYTNIAMHCLTAKEKLSFEDYFNVWFDNLVTTITTNEENMRLKNHQKTFAFGVDCWTEMYYAAGVKLVQKPDFRSYDEKRKWGLI